MLDILALGEETRVLMEATGRYHEPVVAALHEYTPMEAIREQLKLCSCQYNLYMKNVVALACPNTHCPLFLPSFWELKKGPDFLEKSEPFDYIYMIR